MKKLLVFALLCLVTACAAEPPAPKETYPYGMTEREWNELSIKDKARIRRDFYFYEKGSTHFVNPNIDVEGRKQETNVFLDKPTKSPAEIPEAPNNF